jgi:hypothetical protein
MLYLVAADAALPRQLHDGSEMLMVPLHKDERVVGQSVFGALVSRRVPFHKKR